MADWFWRSFRVGGDPTKIAFLADDLSDTLDKLQEVGWIIVSVNLINNTRAWDSNKQTYTATQEFIIVAKK